LKAYTLLRYDPNQKFSGIIFLHDINMAKIDWQTQRRNVTLLKKLCGKESMKNVVVVTSFWDRLSEMSSGIEREGELKAQEGLLKELHTAGAMFVRSGHFAPGKEPRDPSFLSPKEVVDYLLSIDPTFVEMQKGMGEKANIADPEGLQERLNRWEKDGEDMRRRFRQWEDRHTQVLSPHFVPPLPIQPAFGFRLQPKKSSMPSSPATRGSSRVSNTKS
jgi:hypothetical protein